MDRPLNDTGEESKSNRLATRLLEGNIKPPYAYHLQIREKVSLRSMTKTEEGRKREAVLAYLVNCHSVMEGPGRSLFKWRMEKRLPMNFQLSSAKVERVSVGRKKKGERTWRVRCLSERAVDDTERKGGGPGTSTSPRLRLHEQGKGLGPPMMAPREERGREEGRISGVFSTASITLYFSAEPGEKRTRFFIVMMTKA